MAALKPADVPKVVAHGGSCRVDEDVPARFKAGDEIVCRNINPTGHTRLPRYLRGHRGTVAHDHGVFILPDTNAHQQGQSPQHVYSVRFDARELWGRDGGERDAVYADVWDDYMDPANGT